MEKSKLFYPDCIFNLNEISLSTFLYFQEELSFTLHPTASLFLAKCDPFYFAKLIDESNYNWKNYFLNIFSVWKQSTEMIRHTYNLLSPLKSKKYLKGILLSYSRTEEALRENEDMVKSTDLSTEELLRIVNIPMASQELIAHILFEKFLEIYKYPIREKAEDIDELLNEEPITENIDYKELLNYCNHLFTNYTIEQALVNNYFYRLKIFQHLPDILLTNGNLINFLNRIPRKQDINSELSYYEGIDLISWEIFRQITTPYIEEKSPEKRIELIENFREQNSEEINNLKNKCMKLAEQYKGDRDFINFSKDISQHVKVNTEKEINDLLRLEKKQFQSILDNIFSDEKTWLAVGAFITSILSGGPLLTAGTALAITANIGAKTYKEISTTEKKIEDSDYALIYRMHNF